MYKTQKKKVKASSYSKRMPKAQQAVAFSASTILTGCKDETLAWHFLPNISLQNFYQTSASITQPNASKISWPTVNICKNDEWFHYEFLPRKQNVQTKPNVPKLSVDVKLMFFHWNNHPVIVKSYCNYSLPAVQTAGSTTSQALIAFDTIGNSCQLSTLNSLQKLWQHWTTIAIY